MVPAQFTVILPHNCECEVTEVVGERPEADIVIRSEPFWRTPVSLQSRGCGQPGDRMEIPWSWIIQNYKREENTTGKIGTDTSGKILSWQFLKLRFGVMSNSGFQGDPVYPPPPGLTSCSENLDCDIEASKHEALCSGRSVREVIEDSEDFSRLKNQINRPNWETFAPEIKFVRQLRERIVIVLETAKTLEQRGQWKFLAKAVKNLILHDLPENSEVGLVTFSSSGRIEVPLTKMDAVTRPRVADIVPDKYRLASTDLRCVECGLETALRMSEVAPSHLLLITSNDSLSHVISEAVMSYLDTRPVRVSSLLLSSSPVLYYDTLARVSGGQVATAAPDIMGPISGYLNLMRQLREIVCTGNVVTSHEAVVTISEANLMTEGRFEVFEDSKDTEMLLLVEDVYSHLVRSVEFIEARSGQRHGPFYNLVTSRAGVNMLSVYMSPLPRISTEVASSWGYKILWYPPERSETVEAGVIVQTRTETGLYDVRLWTSSDLLTEMVTEDSPLILYASVSHRASGLPVLRARVTAHCKLATEAGLKTCEDIELVDNGSGDPDITADDGVYSRYMIKYPGEGRYEFSVTASDDNEEAFIATNVASLDEEETELEEKFIEEECCGSRVNLFNKRIRNTGHFTEISSKPIVKHLIQVFSSGNMTLDKIPPAKIGDLTVEMDPESGQLVLTFTAPGDDFDHGQADSYKVIAARNRNEMFNESLIASEDYTFLEFRSEKLAGQRISFLISFNIYNEDIFIGVVGVDENENIGRMSNVVKVFMPRMEPEEQTEGSPHVAAEQTEEDYSLVLALSGAIVFLSSFLGLGILYFLKMLRSRKTAGGSVHDHVLTDTGSDDSHSPCATDHSGSLASLGQSTPAYWSASDLLSKHESKLGFVTPMVTPLGLSDQRRQWSVAPLARELFLDSISEGEEEGTGESSDDGQNLESTGYRDTRVQRIVSFNTSTFHHPRNLSFV